MGDKTAKEEVRKLQFTGRASYIVSLPKGWVKQVGLEPGDQIEIRLQENSFVLTPRLTKREESLKEATVIVAKADSPQTLSRKMISLYLVGYEIVHVRSEERVLTPIRVTAIKDVVHNTFIGAEIISESDEEITFQILLSSAHFSVEHALRRIVAIISSMSRDIVSALKNLDEDKAKNIIAADGEVNRFRFYIIRQLKSSVHDEQLVKRIGLKKQKECLGYRIEIKNVERIADSIVDIAEHLLSLSGRVTESSMLPNISELASVSTKLFEDVMKAHFKRDFNLAESIISETLELEERVKKTRFLVLNSKLDAVEQLELVEILDYIKQIANYCREIAEVLLNRTVEESPSVKIEL